MNLLIEREQLLGPLNTVSSVVERRQTLPILANVLLQLHNNTLTLVGTDLEVETTISTTALDGSDGQFTEPVFSVNGKDSSAFQSIQNFCHLPR